MANELKTYGDLKTAIKSIANKQKGEKIAGIGLDVLTGFIPGAEAAKTTFDFIKAAISKPDNKKTKTWLDKLDIDDNMSRIIDNTIENGFMQAIAKSIEGESDSKPLEQDFNMNQKLVDYLKTNYAGRTVTGIKENKMKKSQLKQLIKEEIKSILNEQPITPTPQSTSNKQPQQQKQSPEVKKLIDYLNASGKSALGAISNRTELNQILTAIWNGMSKNMQTDASAKSVYNIISQKIK